MIRINLLPEKDVKKRRPVERTAPSSQVSPLTIAVAVALFAVLGGFYFFYVRKPLADLRTQHESAAARDKKLDKEIETLRAEVGSLKVVDAIGESMLDIVESLDPDDRILWSEKLNQISDLVPENVFVTRITVTEEIKKVETAGSIRQRKQYTDALAAWKKAGSRGTRPDAPDPIYYPEVKQSLTIFGIAYSPSEPERIRLINSFWDNLTNGFNPKSKVQTKFMDGFLGAISYGVIETKDYGGRLVADFSFKIDTKPTSPSRSGV